MGAYVLGITGGTGIILARRAAHWLTTLGHTLHVVTSKAGAYSASVELGTADFLPDSPLIHTYRNSDIGASIASGSFPIDGMLIMPCSMASLAAISIGLGDNLIRRAADVTLKERRPLVLVPRETPLTSIHLENMLRLSRAGATIIPPMPAWYTRPTTLEDVETHIVGRCLDQLGIPDIDYSRWEGPVPASFP